ncbi:MarR family transcriptional regulator [Acinetobacter baumannii]|uniref:MarR family transcriptional regulator n=1 Tax=Acinetobacter baumannii TaxID=470 RepID=A0A241ZF26_ACIBA|nr:MULTISPECIES: IclR family transcriptional regulator [Acinetobacter calcoaceticus/baumannii complex]AVN30067.1 MarR family transcriptional regulator [Acinetobacter baumannii]EHU1447156.1 MarR family transcriptional regulator [Acinetobacter baumannii]EHU2668670.1 MarR family transcriptional regulator [Acinetobacter baumannii]EHU3276431.1 MarR family transcriptional regulator [Acinetobacter baumannii]EKU7211226.1 MarR family transcriptional regulator [Acinetobacter baumannii]
MTSPNKSAGKVLKVLFALRGHYVFGLSNKQLSESLNESPTFITRALQTLEADGWAEKRDNGNYAPSMKAVKFATACKEEYDRVQARIDEYNQRLHTQF